MKHFETALPDGYEQVGEFNIQNKKVALRMNLVGLVLATAVIVPLLLHFLPGAGPSDVSILYIVLFLVCYAAYIVLHELLHGLAYKILTKGHKLTFGVTLTAAYCGVPDLYVYRTASVIALLTPFTVFTLVFGAGALWLPGVWWRVLASILLGCHIGGCVGDLYDTALFLFRYRDPSTLTRDDGPRQIFYQKSTAKDVEK